MFSTSDSYAFPISYAAIFLGVLPVNLLGYDQNSGWVEYSLTLPVSKKCWWPKSISLDCCVRQRLW